MDSSTLPVNGATIYYEIRGNGPLLVLIPGGNGIAVFYESFATSLSSHFKVIAYDRRGFFRSPLTRPSSNPSQNILKSNADDVAALVSHLSPKQPAFIFACSGSSTIALDLLLSHPHLVRTIILHEPISISMFPYAKYNAFRAMISPIMTTYHESGIGAANRLLMPFLHGKSDWQWFKVTPTCQRLASLPAGMMKFYFDNELPAILDYKVDVEGLKRFREKIIVARGADMSPELASYPAWQLAKELGMSLVTLAGGHTGYVTDEGFFVDYLIGLLHQDMARL